MVSAGEPEELKQDMTHQEGEQIVSMVDNHVQQLINHPIMKRYQQHK